jgi:hypothetical protein
MARPLEWSDDNPNMKSQSRSRLKTLLLAGVSTIMVAVAGMLFPDLREADDENR